MGPLKTAAEQVRAKRICDGKLARKFGMNDKLRGPSEMKQKLDIILAYFKEVPLVNTKKN
jgi:hypothetical protein